MSSCVHLYSIGYPVVTLGFGFKSYVSYKMRLRKQKEVQKENEFYMQLLQQALPPEQQMLQRQEREAEEGKIQTHTHTYMHTICTHEAPGSGNMRLTYTIYKDWTMKSQYLINWTCKNHKVETSSSRHVVLLRHCLVS